MTKTFQKIIFGFLLIFPQFSFASIVFQFAFVYPGGEGTKAAAKPFLDELMNQIKKNGGPTMQAAYYPSLDEGVEAVRFKKAQVGIVSYDFYFSNKERFPMEILLSTIPVSTSKPEEQSYLMMHQSTLLPQGGSLTIFTSRNLGDDFLRTVVFRGYTSSLLKFEIDPNILVRLKSLSGTQNAVLLDSFEYKALKNLKLPWINELQTVYTSNPYPSAPVVSFVPLESELKAQLTKSLLKVAKNPQSQEILNQLRLQGFTQ
ncbi:MAG: hypothetical protein A3G32_03285 [Deltaproteobacteria bacterium RIFCSPLOWO2_12_FULL_40_28]|nr:MAG: hypothetical protein A3C45_01970 [Deltaproteobacteria bacterium RIFCSPHIGHO2_02_FULL_40_28]OGQ20121.1 MAG: hypothetical protein A3E27_01265 [Deltaproteobacteria bacterium RIFCSPHIGHO2_12_FULL_40_32]OGQ40692.1 MAG: hypothetical protein A3I69_02530 [Deltaproteobacteria bacterium RIFCSPLOWO2_02_FULL_40_36]OGQ54388.1 MAG: hypothetical protein A3G32_03285 [Deltaproteobacteria bacterium RIFCSPLOWO2_12_FULL_40_28]